MINKDIIFGLYDDETELLEAVRSANAEHLHIYDVFSPFHVHGLEPLLGLAESRLHIMGFVYGAIGLLTSFLGMTWIFTSDWPVIIGGKPYWSVPAFIPITFEMTVLFASVGMTVTFFMINGQGPGVTNPTLHDRITDDKFCIAFDRHLVSDTDAKKFFKKTGASLVDTKYI